MAPNGVNINGQFVNTPGTYGTVVYASTAGITGLFRNIAVLGELPYLPYAVPVEVFNQPSLEALQPSNIDLLRISQSVYNASDDDRVPGAPSSVILCNVQPNTQAFVNLVDANGDPTILLQSTVWGSVGNQTQVTASLDGSGYDITLTRQGVTETYLDIVGYSLFTLDYVGGDFAAMVSGFNAKTFVASGATLPQSTITVDSTAAFPLEGTIVINTSLGDETITYTSKGSGGTTFLGCTGGTGVMTTSSLVTRPTKEFYIVPTGTEAIGTQAYGIPWLGKVSIKPSTTPAASETYTVTITGLDLAGAAQTAILTWVAADTSVQKYTDESFSYLTQIVFAQAGGVPTSPSFTIKGDVMRVDSSIYPTAGSLADYLDTDANFTVTAISDVAGNIPLDQIDTTGPTTITYDDALTFANTVNAIVDALATSALVTATAVDGGDVPVALAEQFMTGGSQTSTSLSDWTASLVEMRQVPCALMAVLSESSSVQDALKSHLVYMAGPGRNPRAGWVGAPKNTTLSGASSLTASLNTRLLGLVVDEIKRPNPVTGASEWRTPMWWALQIAAMQCGTNEGLTYKRPNVDDFRRSATIPGESAANNPAIAASITILAKPLNGQAPPLTCILRALTTIRTTSDPARTDPRAVQSLNELLNFSYTNMVAQVGEPTTVPLKVIQSTWRSILTTAIDQGIIAEVNLATATVVRQANVLLFVASVVPAYTQEFFVFQLQVSQAAVSGAVIFQQAS